MEESRPVADDILEFAAARTNREKPCWVCSLPERSEIDKGLNAGLRTPTIAAFLKDKKGYRESTESLRSRIRTHQDKRHHE